MSTTDQKPKKKLTLTQQLAELKEKYTVLEGEKLGETNRANTAEQEVRRVLEKKDQEMRDILSALAAPLMSMEEGNHLRMNIDSTFYGRPKPSVQQLAGELAGAIARALEKGNLKQAILEEQDTQIEWFQSLIEKAFGVKAKPPKVDPKEANPENNHEPKKK